MPALAIAVGVHQCPVVIGQRRPEYVYSIRPVHLVEPLDIEIDEPPEVRHRRVRLECRPEVVVVGPMRPKYDHHPTGGRGDRTLDIELRVRNLPECPLQCELLDRHSELDNGTHRFVSFHYCIKDQHGLSDAGRSCRRNSGDRNGDGLDGAGRDRPATNAGREIGS
jgi:hypothetical protein